MSNLRILNPGLQTTIQDLGRPGYQRFGIPVGGALDPVSLRAANTLVGNPPDAAALEIAYLGPTFIVEAESVRLAFFGADAAIHVFRKTSPSIRILVFSPFVGSLSAQGPLPPFKAMASSLTAM